MLVLIKHLPRDSAVQRELHGEAAEWSIGDHLLAAAVDHLAISNWMFACVNTGEDSDPPEAPTPVPRPGAPTDGEDGAEASADPVTGGEGAPAEESALPSHHAIARFFG
ncbi:hypothetical protein [Streptomyces sp. NPDC051180]|uniref:hypothetical protein n=1 Tax=unclassified Streptomyces TaxID=2593676 RepID=UPI00344DA75F